MPGTDPSIDHRPTVLNRRRLLFGALPAAALLVAGCAQPDAVQPDAAQSDAARPPLALVYNGPQGCTACAPTIATLLRQAPRPFQVKYVDAPLTAAALAGADLYVQPGGGADLEATWQHLSGSAEVIRDWVRQGGSYLGLCFGAYLAGSNPGFPATPAGTPVRPVRPSPTTATPWWR